MKTEGTERIPEEKPMKKTGTFEQDTDQNKEIHKQALGPNTNPKR